MVIGLFIKYAIGNVEKVAKGSLSSPSKAKVMKKLDHVLQALTKLFQVHFYLTDRGKKLQVCHYDILIIY